MMLVDLGLLLLRLVVGLLLVGHGAQKLFGWFGGPGFQQWTNSTGKMGLRPASFWAFLAGITEFGGGVLLALGLLNPLGSLGIIAAMLMAIVKVHWSKGLWGSKGGSEYPLTLLVAALALAMIGPGTYSLDAALGITLSEPITLIGGLVLAILGVATALLTQTRQPAPLGQANKRSA